MTYPTMKHVQACDIINARHLQTFTITSTAVDLSGTTEASQTDLNKVVETIALNGQPTQVVLTDATHMTVSIEHTGAWVNAAALQTALNALGFGASEFTVA